METPVEIAAVLRTVVPDTVEEWSVWNDAEVLEPRFVSGELHPNLREMLLETPLYMSAIPGSAKRFMLFTNEQRSATGAFLKEGFAVLKMRTITRTPMRVVTGEELASIDEGRRPNG